MTILKIRHLYQDLKDIVLDPHFSKSSFSIQRKWRSVCFLLQVTMPEPRLH